MGKIEVHIKYRSEKALQLNNTDQFSSVIPYTAGTSELYNVVQPVFDQLRQGYDSCILLYGQSGSGKTYTAIELQELVFSRLCPRESAHLEIYNNNLTDLTDPTTTLRIREKGRQIYVQNLKFHDENQVEIAREAAQGRMCSRTALNASSSRSHYLQFFRISESPATLVLADLAGSEKPAQSKTEGDKLKEGGEINYSLLVLGRVVNALIQKKHAPFRDSKLTLLLKNAFGGAAVTQVFVCISAEYEAESENSLEFALRCAGIENKIAKVQVAEVLTNTALEMELSRLRSSNAELANRLETAEHSLAELADTHDKLKKQAQSQLLSVMCKAKEREAKLKEQFKLIYWDRQRRLDEAEKAHMMEMNQKMQELEADKDYTDLMAFLNLKDDEM